MRGALCVVLLATGDAAARQDCGDWVFDVGPNYDDGVHHLLRGVKAFAPNDAWAVGDYDQIVQGVHEMHPIVVHFDGGGWTLVPTPLPGKGFAGGVSIYLWDIDGVAPDDVWALGHHEHPDDPGTETLALHWDGSGWEVVESPKTGELSSGSFFWAAEAIASDDVWGVGAWANENDEARRSPLAAHWDGSGWTITDVPLVTNRDQELRDVDAVSSDSVWAVGGWGIVEQAPYVVHWDGSEWTLVDPQPDIALYENLEEVEAFADDDVWVTAQKPSGGVGVMLHWNGSGWTEFAGAGGSWVLAGVAPDDIWGSDGNALAHWDGGSWTQVEDWRGDATFAHIVGALDASDACTVFAAGLLWNDGEYSTLTAHFAGGAPCVADIDGNGVLNVFDFLAFETLFSDEDPRADLAAPFGVFNVFDFLVFQTAFGAGC